MELWDSLVQIKGRVGGGRVVVGGKCSGAGQPIERHPSAPSWVEHLSKENAVSRAHHRFGVYCISDPESWCEALLPRLLREVRAVTGGAVAAAGEGQTAGDSSFRIGSRGIDKRKVVIFLTRRGIVVPSQAVARVSFGVILQASPKCKA